MSNAGTLIYTQEVHTDLAEDDAIERSVEGDLDLHVLLAAHDLQVRDARHVLRPVRLPQVQAVVTTLTPNHRNQ